MIITPEIIAQMEQSEAERLAQCAEAANLDCLRIGGGVACFGGDGHVATQCAGMGLGAEPEAGEWAQLVDFYRGRCELFEFKLAPTSGMGWRDLVVRAAVHVPDFESQMVFDLAGSLPPAPGITFKEVTPERAQGYATESARRFCGGETPSELVDFIAASVLVEGSGAWEVFRDGQAVGGCGMGIVGEVAWLSGAAVDPEFRGRGLHKAMQAYRLRLAREQGCKVACQGALAGSISQQNAQKSGFIIAYTRPTFLVSPDQAASLL